jgi:hypothetical protein
VGGGPRRLAAAARSRRSRGARGDARCGRRAGRRHGRRGRAGRPPHGSWLPLLRRRRRRGGLRLWLALERRRMDRRDPPRGQTRSGRGIRLELPDAALPPAAGDVPRGAGQDQLGFEGRGRREALDRQRWGRGGESVARRRLSPRAAARRVTAGTGPAAPPPDDGDPGGRSRPGLRRPARAGGRRAPARVASRPASLASMWPRSPESFSASLSEASQTNRSAPWAKRASRSVGAVSAE